MEDLREHHIQFIMEKCRHFNGIQNKSCKAGIAYGEHPQELVMPCIPKHINSRKAWECPHFEIMSREEAEKETDKWLVLVERVARARKAAKDHAKANHLGKGHGGTGSLKCPSCEKGTLRYSVASYNGHMHGVCSTPGCVSWME